MKRGTALLRLIDAHAHLTRLLPFERLARRWDQAGVWKAAIMVREAREERALKLARRYPGRVLPLFGGRMIQAALQAGSRKSRRGGVRRYEGFDPRWWGRRGESVFRAIRARLESGAYRGIGEIRLKHRGFGPGVPEMKCDYDFEMDSPVILRLLDLAAARRLPVTVHLEVDREKEPRLETLSRALRAAPGAAVIWAHSGPSDAATLDRLLRRHGNLRAEILPLTRNTYADRVPYLKTFPRVSDARGRLLRAWRDLYERRADRFLVGSDCRTAAEYGHLRTRMEDMRLILSQLSGRAAERIACGNAERIFRAS